MKILKKKKIPVIHIMAGDSIVLLDDKTEVMREEIVRDMDLDQAVIFDVEPGDFGPDVKDGIGGAFLTTKDKK